MSDKCGTVSGYKLHERRKEPKCEPCRLVYNASRLEWQRANPDRVKASRGKHYKAFPERAISRAAKRRALKYEVETEKYTTQEVIEAYGDLCHICAEPIDMEAPRHAGDEGWQLGLHIDHLIPMSKGGPDTLANVRPAHGLCNIRKHNSLLEGEDSR